MKLVIADKKRLTKIKELYKSAFPRVEQKPFPLLRFNQKRGITNIFSIEDNDEFCGLAMTIEYKDRVLLIYFAIAEDKRGTGIGTKALQILLEKYKDKRLYLEIESTKVPCENYESRQKRKKFYLKNGLTELDYGVNLFSVDMEILINGKNLSFEEYKELYLRGFSRFINHKIKRI